MDADGDLKAGTPSREYDARRDLYGGPVGSLRLTAKLNV